MSVELGHPDPMDPFEGNSAISLLPRTFKDLKPTQSSMQESLQSLFESLAPRGQDALRDMAETVLKSSSEFQNFKTRQEDVVKDIPTKLKGHVKEPQPAEGRKRARLSIIPNMSQPLLQKSSSSLDQIEDPADFLSAFERLEKPDKELEKPRDHILMDSTQSSSETQQVMHSEDAEKDIPANMRDRGRERRPSLGLKPAKFSFKLNTSQPSSVEEMSLDIGKYQDPEEFIAAMDRMERANKEIRRLRGQTDSTEQKSSTTTRERRSGILGKRGTYKHLYPLAEANRDEVLEPYHEASKVDTLNHSSSNTETTNKHTTSQEKEVACDGHLNPLQDSVSEPETTSNGILDELLSDTSKDLDEDEVLERLHIPRLQYEPINLEKFSLPELDILRKTNARALVRSTRPRKALSDIHNVVMGSKRPVETHKISVHPQASHTPSESPLSLVHALRRSIAQKDSCNNLFSFSGIDLSPSQPASSHLGANHDDATDPMLAQATGNGSSFSGKFQSLMTLEDSAAGSSVDVGKLVPDDLAWSPEPRPAEANGNGPGFSERFQSLMTQEDNTAGNNMNSDKLVTDDLACPPDPTPAQPNGNGSSFSGKFQSLMTQEDNAAGSSMNLDKLVTDDLAYQAEPVDDNLSKLNTQLGPMTNECDNALQDKGEEMQQEVMATPDEQEPAQSGNGQTDYSNPAAGKSHTEDGHPETTIIGPEQNTEGQREPPTMSLNARSELKEPARRRSKRNDLMRRKSLAGAGTVWEAGVRKSTRNKMRPLEYWKGERFLYGRVHESLLTVIGCKYQSPEKDGKSKFKVKYYVSDEHKLLVDQVARH